MKKVDILDCTLRDGSYLTGFSVTRQATEEVVADLDAAGVKYIEVGHGMGLGARNKFHSLETDETYIRAAVSRRKKAMIGCFFIPSFGTKEQIATGRDLGMDFIRIGSNITEHESMKPYVDYAKEVGLKVFVNLMKTYAVSPEKLRQVVSDLVTWKVDTIVLVDSAGCMVPPVLENYLRVCHDFLSDAKFGFHGHNNLQMAAANTVLAAAHGFAILDSTLRGAGRDAGNTQTEILIAALEKMDFNTGIDLYKVLDAAQASEKYFPTERMITTFSVINGLGNFHSGYSEMFRRISEEESCDLRDLILMVGRENCADPTPELVRGIAQDLSRKPKMYSKVG